jgi:hypothetical protein
MWGTRIVFKIKRPGPPVLPRTEHLIHPPLLRKDGAPFVVAGGGIPHPKSRDVGHPRCFKIQDLGHPSNTILQLQPPLVETMSANGAQGLLNLSQSRRSPQGAARPPPRLKPILFGLWDGTAEAVPLQKDWIEWAEEKVAVESDPEINKSNECAPAASPWGRAANASIFRWSERLVAYGICACSRKAKN